MSVLRRIARALAIPVVLLLAVTLQLALVNRAPLPGGATPDPGAPGDGQPSSDSVRDGSSFRAFWFFLSHTRPWRCSRLTLSNSIWPSFSLV